MHSLDCNQLDFIVRFGFCTLVRVIVTMMDALLIDDPSP